MSVTSLNTLTGAVGLTSGNPLIGVGTTANNVVVTALASGITGLTVQGQTPQDPLTSGQIIFTPGAGISMVTDSLANTLTIGNTAVSLNLEGLYNKLGAFPATPFTSDTIALASANTGAPPTAIVPDGTPPTASTTPEGELCWLYTKPTPALTGFNWYMYNPRFPAGAWSATTAYVVGSRVFLAGIFYDCIQDNTNQTPPNATYWTVYTPPPLPIIKNKLQSVWALIQPAINTNIYQAGVIALNVYTYDDANAPSGSGFYNSRWAYSNQAGINSGQTGVNLYAGYTYLVYAFDAPRIVNVQGVGMPDSQPWGLRDPYDVHPEVNHIALANTVIAFQPWTDGTNYRTWNAATSWVVGDTVVFSGTTGTPTGLFYTCAVNNTNTPPVSATGVPSASWAVITPQPSSYATKPVSLINVNGISGTTSGWVAGDLLRVLEIGYSYGADVETITESVRYKLN